jgi:nitrite reductase/ring-hydroxylating ferredoxin subunit
MQSNFITLNNSTWRGISLKHLVCKIDELKPGEKQLIHINRTPVIVARNSDTGISAFYGRCPHHGADFNRSDLTYETVSDDPGQYGICRINEIIRCPWHGFEYDTKSGESIVDPKNLRMKTYKAYIEEENIVVEI